MMRQATYQAANRTSIRDPENRNPKKWSWGMLRQPIGCRACSRQRVHDLICLTNPCRSPASPVVRRSMKLLPTSRLHSVSGRAHKDKVVLERLIRLDVVNANSYRANARTIRRPSRSSRP
jgi:hypothetical protein